MANDRDRQSGDEHLQETRDLGLTQLPTGRKLGRYRVLEKIGAGGMGEVYRAHDGRLDRNVAIKLLPSQMLTDKAARKRFRKEALALSKLNHPNIATVHDFDSQDGIDFLVMEYVPGTTLSEKLLTGPLSEEEILDLGAQLADGLEAAHAQKIVHRDLKPGNLRITSGNRLKILDFGLAKLVEPASDSATRDVTETLGIAGTVPYMPPEQLRGLAADERSDIYSAGAVLYEMASGQRMYRQAQVADLIHAILTENPKPLREVTRLVSSELDRVIQKALAKDPKIRYQTARELRADLERLRSGQAVLAPKRGRVWARWQGGALAGVIVVATVLALDVGSLRERLMGASKTHIASLAVMPLQNLSGDSEQEFFADGLTEILISDVNKLPGLERVAFRQSAMQLKGSEASPQDIARQLNVDALVQGAVLRTGDQVQVTARLIEAGSGDVLWADTFERPVEHTFVLLQEIAQAIAGEIEVALSPEYEQKVFEATPVAPKVLEAYLRGNFQIRQWTQSSISRGMEQYRLSIQMDPDFAPGYVGLANGYVFLAAQGMEAVPAKESYPKAKELTLKALGLQPKLAEAHRMLGAIYEWEWNWGDAESEYRRAIDLDPNDAMVHFFYSAFLESMGRYQEAMVEARRAQELDPFDAWNNSAPMWRYFGEGRFQEALAEGKKSLETHPDHWVTHWGIGLSYAMLKMHDESIQQLEETLVRSQDNTSVLASLGFAYAGAGFQERALGIVEELKHPKETATAPSYLIANIYDALAEVDSSFAWLERAFDEHSPYMMLLKRDPCFETIRADSRFADLVNRIGSP